MVKIQHLCKLLQGHTDTHSHTDRHTQKEREREVRESERAREQESKRTRGQEREREKEKERRRQREMGKGERKREKKGELIHNIQLYNLPTYTPCVPIILPPPQNRICQGSAKVCLRKAAFRII